MILVTGGTGYVGSRVASYLIRRGVDAAALVRDADKAQRTLPFTVPIRVSDYDRPDQLVAALSGVDELVLIPSDEPADVLRKHVTNLLGSARDARVKRLVFLSITDLQEKPFFYYAGAYREAEAAIREGFREWVILRCGLYADLVADRWIRPAMQTGIIELAAGEGRMALISRETVASAVAAAALDRELSRMAFTLTGPSALSFGDVAQQASEQLGWDLLYRSCSMNEHVGRLKRELEEPWPEAFASFVTSIRLGRYAVVTSDVERLTGQPSETFRPFLRRWAPQATR